ncbi:MAG: M48 family metallopeptidase [Methylococcaceae bacterium]
MTSLSDLPFSYTIRHSPRATRTRIIVSDGKVEVVAPVKTSVRKIHQFVDVKQHWILSALAKMSAKRQSNKRLAPTYYGENAEIPYRGNFHQLTVKQSALKRIKIEFSEGFIAYLPEPLLLNEHSDAIRTALISWMKKQAMLHVQELVERHAGKKQLIPRSINIRTQKSRWGSCGIHNDIQINWLLILAPVDVLEYVVVHELCHIQVKNHSSRFWDLVALHLPGFQDQKNWLKQYGGHLMGGL